MKTFRVTLIGCNDFTAKRVNATVTAENRTMAKSKAVAQAAKYFSNGCRVERIWAE